jgi:hypothetical protein
MILDRMAATMGVLRDTCGDRVDQARTFLTSSRIGPESHCSGDLVSSAILQIFCKIAEHQPCSADLRSLRLCRTAAISAKLQIFCNFARYGLCLSDQVVLGVLQYCREFAKSRIFCNFAEHEPCPADLRSLPV